MTLTEIAMAKYFARYHGRDEMFISLYRRYKLKENPASLEKYLQQVAYEKVFLSAFYFYPNSMFRGQDYWYDFQQRFNSFCKNNKDEFPMSDIKNFSGKAGKALRKNWDNPDFRKTESRIDTSDRYGVNLPKDTLQIILEEHQRQGYERADTAPCIKEEETADPLAGFDVVEIGVPTRKSRRLEDDEISFNSKSNTCRITFNQAYSYDMAVGTMFSYVQLGTNKEGGICLLFNNERGVPVQKMSEKHSNLTISNKKLGTKLAELLGIKEDYSVLKVKKIAHNENLAAFLVSR